MDCFYQAMLGNIFQILHDSDHRLKFRNPGQVKFLHCPDVQLMLVVSMGTIGAIITLGFLGLFLCAVVLSIGYVLFDIWLNSETPKAMGSHPN